VKGYLFLDVDGVLNAFAARGIPDGWKLAQVKLPGFHHPLPILYDPGIGAKLLQLAQDFDCELVWCTTWQDQANEHIAPLVGLPELPFIPLTPPKMHASVGQTKAFSIRSWLTEKADHLVPFVWFEDETDAGYSLQQYKVRPPWLIVQCNPRDGLTDGRLIEARAYLIEATKREPVL
jgi:hypothetical protein